MLKNWKLDLMRDWNFMRLFRLGLAVLVLVEAWKKNELLFAVLGGILLFQALLNIGCCGTSGCNYRQEENRSGGAAAEDITFEEIKDPNKNK